MPEDRGNSPLPPDPTDFARRFRPEISAWVVLAISLLTTLAGWYVADQHAQVRARERFDHEVELARLAIAKRMQEYQNALRGGIGLFRASDVVTRKDWHDYVATLELETYWPGIQGMGFSLMVAPSDLESHQQNLRIEGFADYSVYPKGIREQYSAIVYLEPFAGRNLRAFGFDMFSEPVRRAAMERARDTGTAAVSGRVTLVQETGEDVQQGFLMYLPVYRAGARIDTEEERRAAILGFVYSPFRVRDLMRGILGDGPPGLEFSIYDDREIKAEALLYDSRGSAPAGARQRQAALSTVRHIELPGRYWTVSFESSPTLEQEIGSTQPAVVAVAGVAVDLLLFAIILTLARQRRQAATSAGQLARLLTEVSEANNFSRQLIETANVMVVGLDATGKIAIFNHMAETICGRSAAEVLGQPWFGFIVPKDVCGDLADAFLRIPETQSFPGTHEYPIVAHNGEKRLISWKTSVVPGNKTQLRTLSFGIDITDDTARVAELEEHRHHLEDMVARRTRELEDARQEAETANRAKSLFLANMSHELRTPMNAILGLTHLIQRDTRDMAQLERLEKVSTAANQLLGILNDILDISNIEANRLTLDLRTFRLENTIFNTAALFSDKAAEKGLELDLDIDPNLAAGYRGDPIRLQQILTNFCSNAIKFTDSGAIVLQVRRLEIGTDADLIRFEVRDSGIGMPADMLASIGKAFTQADATATRKYGGTGLGLAICKRLVEHMGGEMGASSTPGQGSTFWFTIHLGKDKEAVPPGQGVIPGPLLSATERDLRERHAGTRVLLAEDNPINQEVIRELIDDAGLAVDVAGDGYQALALARTNPYRLVLLDIQMPGLDGIAVARDIRHIQGYAQIPVLALTANAFEEDKEKCLAAGMNAHLGKPVDPEELYTALLHWLDQGSAAADAA